MTLGKPLDESYFEWLYAQIGSVTNRNPERSYWKLAEKLYVTEFVYFIPNDENRASDGIELREEFLDQSHIKYDEWVTLDCSVLEMMIALARRADFQTDEGAMPGGVGGWFRKFLENLRLSKMTDAVFDERALEVANQTISKLNNRKYAYNGRGGLFPLKRPTHDQREVELWYQLAEYLLENNYVDVG